MSDEKKKVAIITSYNVMIKSQIQVNGKTGKRKQKGICALELSDHKVDITLMEATANKCLEALSLCVDIFLGEWAYLSAIPVGKKKA